MRISILVFVQSRSVAAQAADSARTSSKDGSPISLCERKNQMGSFKLFRISHVLLAIGMGNKQKSFPDLTARLLAKAKPSDHNAPTRRFYVLPLR
jgi:hypothetical protein